MSEIVNTRDYLMDEIEAIQEYCEENNIGLNEERLEMREMIADMILRKLANEATKKEGGLILQRVSNNEVMVCPECNGSGKVKSILHDHVCDRCSGEGQTNC